MVPTSHACKDNCTHADFVNTKAMLARTSQAAFVMTKAMLAGTPSNKPVNFFAFTLDTGLRFKYNMHDSSTLFSGDCITVLNYCQ